MKKQVSTDVSKAFLLHKESAVTHIVICNRVYEL